MVRPCIWLKEEPSQFSMAQTAQSLTCSITEKSHTGLDECPRILLWWFRANNSDNHPLSFVITATASDEEEEEEEGDDSGVHDEPSTSVSQFQRFSLQGWLTFVAFVVVFDVVSVLPPASAHQRDRVCSIMYRVRPLNLGWCFLPSKVASDTPFLGRLWTDLATILVHF